MTVAGDYAFKRVRQLEDALREIQVECASKPEHCSNDLTERGLTIAKHLKAVVANIARKCEEALREKT